MAFNTLSAIKDFFAYYEKRGVAPLNNYKIPLLNRIERTVDKDKVRALVGGLGMNVAINTTQPRNAQASREGADWPLPMTDEWKKLNIAQIPIRSSVGMSKAEREDADQNGLGDMPKYKLMTLKGGLQWRLNLGVHLDGTGRLARVASEDHSNAAQCVITVDNTAYDFGWDDVFYLEPGMLVDIYTPSDSSNWTIKGTNAKVIAVNNTAKTVTLATAGAQGRAGGDWDPNGTANDRPADNDIIFLHGTVVLVGGSGTALSYYNDVKGLHFLADVGTSSYSGGGYGAYSGAGYFGLTRTSYPSLQAKVVSYFNGSAPGDWSLSDLLGEIDDAYYADTGTSPKACYAHPLFLRAMANKAAAEMNATFNLNGDQKITGGYYTRELNVDGRLIPLIPSPKIPPNTAFFVDENMMGNMQKEDIHYFNPYDGSRGPEWFGTPGSRAGSFEKWMEWIGQLYATDCRGMIKFVGCRVDV